MWRCVNVEMCRCGSVNVEMCRCGDVQMWRYGDLVLKTLQSYAFG